MRQKDTFDVLTSLAAVAADAMAVYGGFMLAVWIRFDSGWVPLIHDVPPRGLYVYGSGVATLLMLFIFRSLGLYVRPQLGTFSEQIPRLVRSTLWGIFLAIALAFVIRTEPPFSRVAAGMSFFTTLALVLIERALLFRAEIVLARRKAASNRVLVLGSGDVARRFRDALAHEPRLRSAVVGFVAVKAYESESEHGDLDMKGTLEDLDRMIAARDMDQIILVDNSLPHERMVDIIVQCERNLIDFALVPDIFRVLTSGVDVQMVDGIPLLGISKWPLDYFWNRMTKRAEDVIGSVIGLVLAAPVVAAAAVLIRKQSHGPVFYRQERCGENGRVFMLYKLRTMKVDAEEETGPVWAREDDVRRTPVGSFLRRFNLDELPQFWNVLKGDMSLVGPRPERPHFVEQFKEDISRYMWRHVSKPGMTGWAQINGLRGNTSIQERIKYDLYYLENWSLAFDFKILARTFLSTKNAY